MIIDKNIKPEDLYPAIEAMWEVSGNKIKKIEARHNPSDGAPVFTIDGKYTSRGWTEWTQGFQYGSSILQFEATGDDYFLTIGRKNTVEKMAPHLTHIGVHDHGFNNVSTYGNLLRLAEEGKVIASDWEKVYYRLALQVSGAVQATRWTPIPEGGFIHSFNGPHSLFVDTVRSVRIVLLSYAMGHQLKGENDVNINLLKRAVQHIEATAKYNVFYGEGKDFYDTNGRTAHECIFNTTDGQFRSTSTQQGYSGFSTWTRGLAWAMCGFAEQLELIEKIDDRHFEGTTSKEELKALLTKGAKATCDFFIANTAKDGIPYWDTGAPGLKNIPDLLETEADPFNDYEPVDSSAAAIGAQGLIRLGVTLNDDTYLQAGLSSSKTLFSPRYTSQDATHEGLLLHSIYHRPNDWDGYTKGQKIPNNEACMWGDYHLRELAILIQSLDPSKKYYQYFNCLSELA